MGTTQQFDIDYNYGDADSASHTATLIQASKTSSNHVVKALKPCVAMVCIVDNGVYVPSINSYNAGDTIVSFSLGWALRVVCALPV